MAFTFKQLPTSKITALKRGLVIVFTFVFFRNGFAQLSYTMTPSVPGYTLLSGGTSIPDLSAGSDMTISPPIPIGFNFTFDGMVYAECQASDNGYLHFGNELSPTGYGNASGDLIIPNDFSDATASDGVYNTTRPFVAPLWEELAIAGIGGGNTSYLTQGTSPNQTFTIEWDRVSWRAPTATNQISFQVVLHETTNVIDFIYKQGPNAIGNLPTASIGLAGIANGDYYSLSDSGPNPVVSKSVNTTTIDAKPADGQMYTWAPYIPTSINDARSNNSLNSVYFDGNSNQLKVTFNLKNEGEYEVEVLNMLGHSICKEKIHIIEKGKTNYNLNIPACANGIYIAKITGQNTSGQLKFVKD